MKTKCLLILCLVALGLVLAGATLGYAASPLSPTCATPPDGPRAEAVACVNPPSGLVGWWPGDGNAKDIVGGNDGTLSGVVTFTAGIVNQTFSFDGCSGEVIVPHAPVLDFGPNDSFTIEAWLKPDPSVLGTKRVAVNLTYACTTEEIQLILLADGKIALTLRDSNAVPVVASSPGSILDGQWHHVSAVRDAANHTVTLYLDGVAVTSLADPTTGTFARSDGQNRIGAQPVACPTERYFWLVLLC